VGTDDARHKEEIERFFRKVEKGIHEILRGEHEPLVLAGVEYLHPIYREVNTYPHLVEGGVTGNLDRMSPEEIGSKAWKIIEPRLEEERKRAAGIFHSLRDKGKASVELDKVIPAACRGRVGTLFVAVREHRWGSYDPGSDRLVLHSEEEPGDEDLLDLAAVCTLAGGGRVFVVEPEEVPGGVPVAATMRY
jgi:hypothetical protein